MFKSNEALQAYGVRSIPVNQIVVCASTKPLLQHRWRHTSTRFIVALSVGTAIVRDAKTLGDHMVEHTHPFQCEIRETKCSSEEERSAHFTSSDCHPLCAECQTGFVDAAALQSHVSLNHPLSCILSPREQFICSRCHELLGSGVALEVHMVEVHPIFECYICGELYSAQLTLTDHISMVHSCLACGEGVFGGTP
ncbi:hypothetical protein EDD17DRAFT_1622438 [Pisolithus thermaeus]|nr:hypothetical protein EDD17DRAFT_1622438 [Pisolithus thermaeus]